ncbi:hypothetical protein J1N35_014313, partial [Gossypium stocksii]
TGTYSNYAVLGDLQNQENQDFKSKNSWSKKLNIEVNAQQITCMSLKKSILGANGSQAQVLENQPSEMPISPS